MPKDLSGAQVGTQRKAYATEPNFKPLTGRTVYPMRYKFPNTCRYGEISPFYYQHVKGDDTVPLQSEQRIRTYTMASPNNIELYTNKSYFFVPMQAIYPLNWERIQVQPSHGDDVPVDSRAFVTNLLSSLSSRLSVIKNAVVSSDDSVLSSLQLTEFVRFVILCESVYSAGSLFAQFNIHLQDFAKYYLEGDDEHKIPYSFDTWFDSKFVPFILENGVKITIDGVDYASYSSVQELNPFIYNGVHYVATRRLLDLMRQNSYTVSQIEEYQFASITDTVLNDVIESLYLVNRENYVINLETIIGYQLGCYQFFTDSKIDFIFSADRFRSLFKSLLKKAYSRDFPRFYSWNGEFLEYDVFSSNNLTSLFNHLSYTDIDFGLASLIVYDCLSLLFTHRNSLRYGDYFVSGRPRPFGVGDVAVDTSGASVSVLDITRKIQWQRFLQHVSWAPQKLADYARDVLGIRNAQFAGDDVPVFLAHQTFPVNGFEVENTGANQIDANSITTIINTGNNKYAFEANISNQGIIYGVQTFDVERVYSKTFDRMHLKTNRADDFIPEMQFFGDQPILRKELNATAGDDEHFAYAYRYMEMKLRTSYCAGGYIENLKTWDFITDNNEGNDDAENISPDYIRSNPQEFDRFYSQLTGYSLGNYFHFVVNNINHQRLTRDLVYAPEPLK